MHREFLFRLGVLLLVLWLVLSLSYSYPFQLSYFNELAGGSAGGGKHLSGSSYDWGQSLWCALDYARLHPEARPLYILYDCTYWPAVPTGDDIVPLRRFGFRESGNIEMGRQPHVTRPGWYLLSAELPARAVWFIYDPSKREGIINTREFASRVPCDVVCGNLFLYRL